MEAKFFNSLFCGDSANGVKLCMGLTDGDFWSRPAGVQILYAGADKNNIDFMLIVSAVDVSQGVFEISAGEPMSKLLYVARCANCAGVEEKTFSAAAEVEFDALGNFVEQSCNRIFLITAEQTQGNRVCLKWFYQPVNQAKQPSRFEIFFDDGAGVIDEQNPIGSLKYSGRKFYQFTSITLSKNNYIFCIKAVAADGSLSDSSGKIIIQLNKRTPDGIGVIEYKVV
jgi:hypothetical protein